MDLHLAKRARAKIRISLQGPSGSGKTFSALQLAFGLTGDWKKICVIDTENQSADLYSELGSYYVLSLKEPYSPERYAEAILLCEASGIECIIIDSISHEWNGKGGCLQLHELATAAMRVPNSFQAWATITPRHQAFIDSILQCKCHVISTIRTKTEYVVSERNGKQVPMKVGLAPVTRDGFEYEVTVSLDIDEQHTASSSKDRTGLFNGKPKFQITAETGRTILEWCNAGENIEETVKSLISKCITVEQLNDLYRKYPECSKNLYTDFSSKKQDIMGVTQFLTHSANIGGNGHGTNIS
jgi:hypothetical protein